MTAEFYLQTVDIVFQQHLLPKGQLIHRGHKVDPKAIKDTALLAIEGERDDISGIGQTKAALDISTGLAASKKQYAPGMPLGGLPTAMAVVTWLDPLAYGVDGLRSAFIATSHFGMAVDVAALAGFGTALLALGSWLFSRIEI